LIFAFRLPRMQARVQGNNNFEDRTIWETTLVGVKLVFISMDININKKNGNWHWLLGVCMVSLECLLLMKLMLI
jgi:hypothetical protein